jgi:hypothetical protein
MQNLQMIIAGEKDSYTIMDVRGVIPYEDNKLNGEVMLNG